MEETGNIQYFKITKAWKRNNVTDHPHKGKNPHPHMWIEGSFSALAKDLQGKFENTIFSFWNCRSLLFNRANVFWQFGVNSIFCKVSLIFLFTSILKADICSGKGVTLNSQENTHTHIHTCTRARTLKYSRNPTGDLICILGTGREPPRVNLPKGPGHPGTEKERWALVGREGTEKKAAPSPGREGQGCQGS